MPIDLPREEIQRTLDAFTQASGNLAEAARIRGIARPTLQHHMDHARKLKLKPSPEALKANDPGQLKLRIRNLERDLAKAQGEALNESAVKRHIIGLSHEIASVEPPAWLSRIDSAPSSPGVPTLFVSDLHWAEKVSPSQIGGVNRYNLEIAHKRMDALAEGAVRLLTILSPKLDYPGIVLVLGGDMISGNIHDELTATNQVNSMPAVLDLFGKLCTFIAHMADTFGRVFIPGVSGNHGRDTTKIWNKDRHHTSFDWLLYCFLAKHFEADKRITFFIPDGPDAYYKIFNTRYLLTHGDQFRGGDGMIGALGPIIRGDHKKRSRNAQIEMEYDVMLLGHWHQYIHLTRLIVNGSLKGYDEYAYNSNFGFEPPQQALWVTHPRNGITFRMPVLVDKDRVERKATAAWVSVAA